MFCFPIFAKQIAHEGKIEKVLLYRNQALVTRTVNIDLPEGTHELQILKLPPGIVMSSLHAEGSGVNIRTVSLVTKEVGENPESKVRELDNEIEAVDEKIAKLTSDNEILKDKLKYIDKQSEFTAAVEKTDINKGVLNANTLKELSIFHFQLKEEIASQKFKNILDLKKLQKEKNLLKRKRGELTVGSLRQMDAIIFFEKKEVGTSQIKLNYLVNNSGWSPIYNIHSLKDEKSVDVEFNATIFQASGEDWSQVELILSNASPVLSAVGPGISPFRINLTHIKPISSSDGASYISQQTKNINTKKADASKRQMESKDWKEVQDNNWDLNSAANEYQNLEMLASGDEITVLKQESKSSGTSPSVSFNLDGKITIESKNHNQLIKVNNFNLPASLYRVATPILTSHVYREAEIENNVLEVLLAGPVNIYLGDRFVGIAQLPNIALGQSFVTGFGIDSQIKTRRELVEKKDKIQGGNKELYFKFKILIENFYDKPISLRVMDRVPLSEREGEVRITLDLNEKLSTNELYLQNERSKGILRWDLNLNQSSSGIKARVLEYGYKLELDKNLHIGFPVENINNIIKQEFQEMQHKKYKH